MHPLSNTLVFAHPSLSHTHTHTFSLSTNLAHTYKFLHTCTLHTRTYIVACMHTHHSLPLSFAFPSVLFINLSISIFFSRWAPRLVDCYRKRHRKHGRFPIYRCYRKKKSPCYQSTTRLLPEGNIAVLPIYHIIFRCVFST